MSLFSARWNTVARANAKVASLFALLLFTSYANAQDKTIDVRQSTITVHVGKTGIFSVAGHEHTVDAPIESGALNDSDTSPGVEFRVAAAKMQLRAEGDDKKNQNEIQQTMQDKVLESAKYPEIVFRSSTVEKAGDNQWTVMGNLTLHGATKTVQVSVKKEGSAYSGNVIIKQTDFGIQPINVGGVVKVKNELGIAFRIVVN
jgi:polyisoprenoid-binding protein YceI